jgi:hypothetical protein
MLSGIRVGRGGHRKARIRSVSSTVLAGISLATMAQNKHSATVRC